MTLLRTSTWVTAFVLLASGSLWAQIAAPNTPPGWKTYVDRVHGFSFAYPPLYKLKRRPDSRRDQEEDPLEGALDKAEEDAREGAMEKEAGEGRRVGLRNQSSDGTIDLYLENDRFDLNGLTDHAPTGYEDPPPAVREGENTFYYYGAGGGGVEYADQFFYNFNGKLLTIVFDGPYEGKSPTDETKEIESKMLASFRTFRPKRER